KADIIYGLNWTERDIAMAMQLMLEGWAPNVENAIDTVKRGEAEDCLDMERYLMPAVEASA
ncbi:MAG TPA: hypothetical protein VMX35_01555, partial [Acidobacteriota bacterium]|nr:hypothetical protein [Acidobacteriota bacterium]